MLKQLNHLVTSELFLTLSFVLAAIGGLLFSNRYRLDLEPPRQRSLKGIAILLCCFAVLYLVNLDGYQINDDEGGYLYASWRITKGELPYRDFMTPQMPLFLHTGAALFHYFGPELYVVRLFSVALVLLSAFFLYLLAEEIFNQSCGLFSVLIYLANYLVYYHSRSFRSDPLMMALCLLGLYFLVRAERHTKWYYYLLAGLLYGTATSFKLFGLFPLLGVGLLWLTQLVQGEINLGKLVYKSLMIGIGLVLVPLFTVGGMLLLVPDLYDFLIGHHVKQGSTWSTWQVLAKSITFIVKYMIHNQVLVALVGIGGYSLAQADNEHRKSGRILLFLPLSLGLFFLLPRPSYNRHMMYLIPVFSLLAAYGLMSMFTWQRIRLRNLAFALFSVYLITNLSVDWQRGHRRETDTQKLAALIKQYVNPNEYVVADYASLAFHAQRRMPPLLGGASQGSIASGQTRVEDYLENIEKYRVKLVVVQNDWHGTIQTVPDFHKLQEYLKQNYQLMHHNYKREKETFDIYLRNGSRPD